MNTAQNRKIAKVSYAAVSGAINVTALVAASLSAGALGSLFALATFATKMSRVDPREKHPAEFIAFTSYFLKNTLGRPLSYGAELQFDKFFEQNPETSPWKAVWLGASRGLRQNNVTQIATAAVSLADFAFAALVSADANSTKNNGGEWDNSMYDGVQKRQNLLRRWGLRVDIPRRAVYGG